MEKQANPLISYKEDQFVDSETGEIISLTDDKYKELVFKAPYAHFVDTLSSKKFEIASYFLIKWIQNIIEKFQMQQFTPQEKRNWIKISLKKLMF